MQSIFQERADQLKVTTDEGQVFNSNHDLSLILGPHVRQSEADRHLAYVQPESLVHVEKVSFDPTRINEDFEDFSELRVNGEIKSKGESAFGKKILNTLIYQGLAFSRMQQDDPIRFNRYRDRSFEELAACQGIIGSEYMSGYKLTLLFGLLEKGCLFVPGDANNTQLPIAEANEVRTRHFFTMPEQINGGPDALYTVVEDAAVDYHDMAHYRDIALAKNLVQLDEAPYRASLGVKQDEVLSTHIIRGSAHADSILGQLRQSGMAYRVLVDERIDNSNIENSFGKSTSTDIFRDSKAASMLKVPLYSQVTEDLVVSSLGVSKERLDQIRVEAAKTRDDFIGFAEFVELCAADLSKAGILQKYKHNKKIRQARSIVLTN